MLEIEDFYLQNWVIFGMVKMVKVGIHNIYRNSCPDANHGAGIFIIIYLQNTGSLKG